MLGKGLHQDRYKLVVLCSLINLHRVVSTVKNYGNWYELGHISPPELHHHHPSEGEPDQVNAHHRTPVEPY